MNDRIFLQDMTQGEFLREASVEVRMSQREETNTRWRDD